MWKRSFQHEGVAPHLVPASFEADCLLPLTNPEACLHLKHIFYILRSDWAVLPAHDEWSSSFPAWWSCCFFSLMSAQLIKVTSQRIKTTEASPSFLLCLKFFSKGALFLLFPEGIKHERLSSHVSWDLCPYRTIQHLIFYARVRRSVAFLYVARQKVLTTVCVTSQMFS